MMEKIENYCCPFCLNELKVFSGKVSCSSCLRKFILKDEILVLVDEEFRI